MPRPSKPLISREKAAQTALEVIDECGLAEFGLSKVATRMGVRTPSLYHHFSGKDELLAEVARLILIGGRLPKLDKELDWKAEITKISLNSWREIQKHPNAAPLLLQFFPRTITMGAYDHWMHVLDYCGVPQRWHMTILEGSEKLTFGSAIFAASSRALGVSPYGELDAAKLPWLAGAHASHPLTDEETFIATMRAYLDGLDLEKHPSENAMIPA